MGKEADYNHFAFATSYMLKVAQGALYRPIGYVT